MVSAIEHLLIDFGKPEFAGNALLERGGSRVQETATAETSQSSGKYKKAYLM